MSQPSASPAESLLRETAQRFGLSFVPGSAGLEFEAGQFVVSLIDHPTQPDQLLVQVAVTTLEQGTDPRLYRLLHQLNELARFDHQWLATVDLDGELFLSRTVPVQTCTSVMLEELLAEAIDRAEQLSRFLAPGSSEGLQAEGLAAAPSLMNNAAVRA
jgi:hypothetical protein